MLMLVGLGNPGSKYERHRHNVGFMAVDAIADDHGFSPERTKFQSLIREGSLTDHKGRAHKTLIIKPQTYMNESGRSVREAMRFYKTPLNEIIVFHDELDIAPAKLRIKIGGGNAGHNGLRSIDSHCGNGFVRVRIGIGHPGHKDRVHGYVLGDFAKSDQNWLDDLLRAISKCAPELALGPEQGFPRFQSLVANECQADPKTAPKATASKKTGSTQKKDEPVSKSVSEASKPAPDTSVKNTAPGSKTDNKSPNIFADALAKLLPPKTK